MRLSDRTIMKEDDVSAIEHPYRNADRSPASRMPRVTVAQLFLRAIRRWQVNRAISELRRLDDRQLEDIGISRNDIPRAVEGLYGSRKVPSDRPAPEERRRRES